MNDDGADQPPSTVLLMINSWQATLILGLVTIVFGVIVTAHPNGSLRVLAVLVGIAMIVSGIFHLIRAADRKAQHRLWLGIVGLLFVAIGVVLIRHLHLTLALIGLLVGVSWIVQGVAGLMSAFSGPRKGAVWWAVFGSVSLIAGIVVTASPLSSVTVLAVLVGIWLLVIGLFEIVAALILQHELAVASPAYRPPAPWSSGPGALDGAPPSDAAPPLDPAPLSGAGPLSGAAPSSGAGRPSDESPGGGSRLADPR
jgi:uncharacterized membrane protein HdeD (DUF308 family)